MPDEPTSPAPARDDRDLYCLQCGYNLRGLSGDPRRCPECGHLNSIAEMEVEAEPIRTLVRKLEGTLTACVLAVIAVVGFSILGVYFWLSAFSYDYMRPISFCGLGVVGFVVVWFIAVHRFRSRCGGQSAWRRVLWNYHWRVSVFILMLVALLPASVLLSGVLHEALQALGILVLCVGVIVGGKDWITRRARKDLEPLALNACLSKQDKPLHTKPGTIPGGEQ
jgi:hypothetical protein